MSKAIDEEKRRRLTGQPLTFTREPVSYEEKPYWRRLRSELPSMASEEGKAYMKYYAIADQLIDIGMYLTAEVFRRLGDDEKRHETMLRDLLRAPQLELRRGRP